MSNSTPEGPAPQNSREDHLMHGCLVWASGAFLLFFLAGLMLGPIGPGNKYPRQSEMVQRAHVLALAAFAYANDHDQQWPDGKSSTEICQKLLDGQYISDPTLFYVSIPGKVRPVKGQRLKPENIGWDFTECADHTGLTPRDPDTLPVVFLTGYRLTYGPEGNAVPILAPYRIVTAENDSWFPWSRIPSDPPGLAVAYKSNASKFIRLQDDGVIPNVIPQEFTANGKTYLQLTPEGPLP